MTAPDDALVLGPQGVGPLRLGMSHHEAIATGFAAVPLGSRHDGWPQGCRILQYLPDSQSGIPRGARGTVSPQQGLESILATRRIVTPDGIRLGSTLDFVLQVYRSETKRGELITDPVSPGTVYRIQLGFRRVVRGIALERRRPDCVR